MGSFCHSELQCLTACLGVVYRVEWGRTSMESLIPDLFSFLEHLSKSLFGVASYDTSYFFKF